MGSFLRILSGLITAVLFSFTITTQAAQASDDAILVLDASGSMWGQIEGKTKIEIAREVVGELLGDVSTERRLGLVAYGHNRKGDCSDIEEVSPIGTSRDTIKEAVNSLNPKGKTPLSASVKMAAEKLRYTEEKATVILVSDGIETCNLDPCAVGKELESAGVDFTAHVIGFDVSEIEAQRQLQCLAENTGGRFLSASNADELSLALEETVNVKPETISNGHLILQASELEGGPVIESGLKWVVQQAGGGEIKYEASDVGKTETDVPAGVYDVFVERLSDGLKGEAKLIEVVPSDNELVTIALKLNFEATVRAVPEEGIVAGSEFVAYWTGPERKNDFISVANKDMSAGGTLTYNYITKGNPLKLTAPIDAGTYEVRYVLGKPYQVLARTEITVTAADASVTGPATAPVGTEVSVAWTGPNTKSDFITITKPDAEERAYKNYGYTANGSPTKLRMPIEPGDYEFRYVQAGNTNDGGAIRYRVLARQAVTLETVGATISGPESVIAGSNFSVEWTGPKERGDYVTITTPDAPDKGYGDYAYTANGGPSNLKAPLEPGDYELRFVQNSKKVLARAPIKITAATATISGPANAKVGQEITVNWTGPKERGDYVTVVAAGAAANKYGDYAYTANGEPSKLNMPIEPGAYELRFVQSSKKVLASAPITIEDVEASFDAPSSAVAGSEIAVNWTGPANHRDWVTVVEPSAKDNKYGDYAYTRHGNPSMLTMPEQAGTYELRYVLYGKRVIARQNIQVTAQ